jgi:hypothetical protein
MVGGRVGVVRIGAGAVGIGGAAALVLLVVIVQPLFRQGEVNVRTAHETLLEY